MRTLCPLALSVALWLTAIVPHDGAAQGVPRAGVATAATADTLRTEPATLAFRAVGLGVGTPGYVNAQVVRAGTRWFASAAAGTGGAGRAGAELGVGRALSRAPGFSVGPVLLVGTYVVDREDAGSTSKGRERQEYVAPALDLRFDAFHLELGLGKGLRRDPGGAQLLLQAGWYFARRGS